MAHYFTLVSTETYKCLQRVMLKVEATNSGIFPQPARSRRHYEGPSSQSNMKLAKCEYLMVGNYCTFD